jgi:hypothetical protein
VTLVGRKRKYMDSIVSKMQESVKGKRINAEGEGEGDVDHDSIDKHA